MNMYTIGKDKPTTDKRKDLGEHLKKKLAFSADESTMDLTPPP